MFPWIHKMFWNVTTMHKVYHNTFYLELLKKNFNQNIFSQIFNEQFTYVSEAQCEPLQNKLEILKQTKTYYNHH